MIYLASPYSHEDRMVEINRFVGAQRFTAFWLERGYPIFSPIVYSHQFVTYGLGRSAADWHTFNNEMMNLADRLWVLRMEGWDLSVGVNFEIEHFNARGIVAEMQELV